MKYKILKYFIIFVLFICVSFFLSLKWYFWEPSNIKKGSLVYMLKVPDAAKNFPVWGTDESPEYDVRTDDGLKPSAVIIRYNSTLTFEVLKQRVLDEGYRCENYGSDTSVLCEKKPEAGHIQQIEIERKDRYSHVWILMTGY